MFAGVSPPDGNKLNPLSFSARGGGEVDRQVKQKKKGGWSGGEGEAGVERGGGKGCREAKIAPRNVARLKRKKVRHGGKGEEAGRQ